MHAHSVPTRIAGALFLPAFPLYGGGRALAHSGAGGAAEPVDPASVTTGAPLMLANAAAVVAIGVLLTPALQSCSRRHAYGYLVTRSAEGVFLAAGAAVLLLLAAMSDQDGDTFAGLAVDADAIAYRVGMMAPGIGSIAFCRALLAARLVPAPLALLGMAGYVLLVADAALALYGLDTGVALLVPGGVFEVAFALLLMRRGLPEPGQRPAGLPAATPPRAAAAPS